jgi:hypothetical protein
MHFQGGFNLQNDFASVDDALGLSDVDLADIPVAIPE